jgi:hypothetical protein
MMGSGAKKDAANSRQSRWIVVADDDEEMRTLLSGLFRADGFVVSEAKDGQELLATLVTKTAPDGAGDFDHGVRERGASRAGEEARGRDGAR